MSNRINLGKNFGMRMPAALLAALVPLVAHAASPTPLPWFPFVVALSDDQAADALTTATLPARLRDLATVSISDSCQFDQTANDVAHIMVMLPGTDCSVPVPITSVQMQLNAKPAQIRMLTRQVAAARGTPCFEGPYQPNPRRRAPPTNLAVWSDAKRDFLLSWDSVTAGTLSVALIDKVQHPISPADQQRYVGFLTVAADALPPSCRQKP